MVNPSLPLQILIFCNAFFAGFWFLLELSLFIWKGVLLPFPPDTYGLEIAFLFIYLIVDIPRQYIGSMGNKTTKAGPTALFEVMCLPVLAAHVYYMAYQIYVLQIEYVLNIIAIIYIGSEFLFGFYYMIQFQRAVV